MLQMHAVINPAIRYVIRTATIRTGFVPGSLADKSLFASIYQTLKSDRD